MTEITEEMLKTISIRGKHEIIGPLATAMNEIFPEYEINNDLRIAHFIAQAAHETAGFTTLNELGGPSYFKRYDGRKDLGNTHPGDGNLYHGRGIFQLTGRANYRRYGAKLGLDLEGSPNLAAVPGVSLRVALEYWNDHKLSPLADEDDIEAITKRINGGLNGIDDRQENLDRAKEELGIG